MRTETLVGETGDTNFRSFFSVDLGEVKGETVRLSGVDGKVTIDNGHGATDKSNSAFP